MHRAWLFPPDQRRGGSGWAGGLRPGVGKATGREKTDRDKGAGEVEVSGVSGRAAPGTLWKQGRGHCQERLRRAGRGVALGPVLGCLAAKGCLKGPWQEGHVQDGRQERAEGRECWVGTVWGGVGRPEEGQAWGSEPPPDAAPTLMAAASLRLDFLSHPLDSCQGVFPQRTTDFPPCPQDKAWSP